MPSLVSQARRARRTSHCSRARQIVVTVNDANAGLNIVRRNPETAARMFERNWGTVDRLRELIVAENLADRVSVHHVDAMAFVRLSESDVVIGDWDDLCVSPARSS